MTTNYSRSQFYTFEELTEQQKEQVMSDYCFENSDAISTMYVKLKCTNFTNPENNIARVLPLSMFERTASKFTHGIFATSAFDGYFITIDKSNEYAVVAHKCF